jgi:hypothetical protein
LVVVLLRADRLEAKDGLQRMHALARYSPCRWEKCEAQMCGCDWAREYRRYRMPFYLRSG